MAGTPQGCSLVVSAAGRPLDGDPTVVVLLLGSGPRRLLHLYLFLSPSGVSAEKAQKDTSLVVG